MKVSIIGLAFAAFAASVTTVSAFAASSAATPAATSVDANASTYDAQQAALWAPAQTALKAKTRAEVRQELVRAEKDGQLAALSKLYQGS